MLRSAASRQSYDRDLSDRVGELSTQPAEFRTRWAAHDVRFHDTGIKERHGRALYSRRHNSSEDLGRRMVTRAGVADGHHRALVRTTALAVILAAVLGAGAEGALADGGSHDPRAAIEQSIVPALVSSPHPAGGVTARVLPGRMPAILLDATQARHSITVFGPSGEPYVRLTPPGVEVNMRSPGPWPEATLDGQGPPEPGDARAAPQWRRIGREPRHQWLEPRAHYPPERLPGEVIASGERRTLSSWRIPLEINGHRTELRGATSWVPLEGTGGGGEPDDSSSSVGVPVAVLAVLTLFAAAALFRSAGAAARSQR